MPGFHHVELWVSDLAGARASWGWLLNTVGWHHADSWDLGDSWTAGGAYLTITTSPHCAGGDHNRRLPGMNHIALEVGLPSQVDELMSLALDNGWRALYHERYPHAGGEDHYAGWLENAAGFKVELVADVSRET